MGGLYEPLVALLSRPSKLLVAVLGSGMLKLLGGPLGNSLSKPLVVVLEGGLLKPLVAVLGARLHKRLVIILGGGLFEGLLGNRLPKSPVVMVMLEGELRLEPLVTMWRSRLHKHLVLVCGGLLKLLVVAPVSGLFKLLVTLLERGPPEIRLSG